MTSILASRRDGRLSCDLLDASFLQPRRDDVCTVAKVCARAAASTHRRWAEAGRWHGRCGRGERCVKEGEACGSCARVEQLPPSVDSRSSTASASSWPCPSRSLALLTLPSSLSLLFLLRSSSILHCHGLRSGPHCSSTSSFCTSLLRLTPPCDFLMLTPPLLLLSSGDHDVKTLKLTVLLMTPMRA